MSAPTPVVADLHVRALLLSIKALVTHRPRYKTAMLRHDQNYFQQKLVQIGSSVTFQDLSLFFPKTMGELLAITVPSSC